MLMRRFEGLSTAPRRMAILRASGVVASVTASAVMNSRTQGIHHLVTKTFAPFARSACCRRGHPIDTSGFMIPACFAAHVPGFRPCPHVKTGTDERLGYSEDVSSPQGKLGEPTSVSWEPTYRAQYRHPPFGGSWNSRRGHPPFERWVHYRTCGGRRCRLLERPTRALFVGERTKGLAYFRPSAGLYGAMPAPTISLVLLPPLRSSTKS